MYEMIYEMETANGNKVIHSYTGDKQQIIEAVKIANANHYRIISVERKEVK